MAEDTPLQDEQNPPQQPKPEQLPSQDTETTPIVKRDTIRDFLFKNGPVLYFIAVFVFAIVSSHFLFNYADDQVSGFKVRNIIRLDSIDCSEQDIMTSIGQDFPLLYQRLSQQLNYTKKREEYHLSVMTFFNSQYFSVVSIASVAAVLTAVFLFLILRVGWDSSTDKFRAVFLGLFATTAFFSVQPSLYSHEENIAVHQLALTSFRGIHDNILTVVSTKGYKAEDAAEPPSEKEQAATINNEPIGKLEKVLKELIIRNDKLFAKHKLNISIDASHIPNYQTLANGLEI